MKSWYTCCRILYSAKGWKILYKQHQEDNTKAAQQSSNDRQQQNAVQWRPL